MPDTHIQKGELNILLISVLMIATCGIFYELLLGSISTYFLGSSILHFSITIGVFMFFMGVGSYISKFIQSNLLENFVNIEIALGLIGGFSAFFLYMGFTMTEMYYLIAFIFLAAIGILIGLEIPLVARIINEYSNIKETVANVLSFDYIGALLASVLFPLFLLPYFGIMKTSFLIGLLNISVAIFNSYSFKDKLTNYKKKTTVSVIVSAILLCGFFYSFSINSFFEQLMYQDKILLTKQSQYQRIVFTRWNEDFRLFLNGHLQFSSADEYRYHESFVHIPMLLSQNHEHILILGGGDGMALREILKYADVKHVDMVDLDPEMTGLATHDRIFKKLNCNSMSSPKLTIHNEDAFNFIQKSSAMYSLILIDLPDPNDTGLGKLYSKEFYSFAKKRLAVGGIISTQATSPYFAREAFWCIAHTMQAAFSSVVPYTVYVPSFGQWGFVMAVQHMNVSEKLKDSAFVAKLIKHMEIRLQDLPFAKNFKYISAATIPSLFVFDKDTDEEPTDTNTLNTQKLVQYYEQSLKNWE